MSSTNSESSTREREQFKSTAKPKAVTIDSKKIVSSATDVNSLFSNIWFYFSAFCVIIAFIRAGMVGVSRKSVSQAIIAFFVCPTTI